MDTDSTVIPLPDSHRKECLEVAFIHRQRRLPWGLEAQDVAFSEPTCIGSTSTWEEVKPEAIPLVVLIVPGLCWPTGPTKTRMDSDSFTFLRRSGIRFPGGKTYPIFFFFYCHSLETWSPLPTLDLSVQELAWQATILSLKSSLCNWDCLLVHSISLVWMQPWNGCILGWWQNRNNYRVERHRFGDCVSRWRLNVINYLCLVCKYSYTFPFVKSEECFETEWLLSSLTDICVGLILRMTTVPKSLWYRKTNIGSRWFNLVQWVLENPDEIHESWGKTGDVFIEDVPGELSWSKSWVGPEKKRKLLAVTFVTSQTLNPRQNLWMDCSVGKTNSSTRLKRTLRYSKICLGSKNYFFRPRLIKLPNQHALIQNELWLRSECFRTFVSQRSIV